MTTWVDARRFGKRYVFKRSSAYGDQGPGFIGTGIAYTQGGYETDFKTPVSRVEPVLMERCRIY